MSLVQKKELELPEKSPNDLATQVEVGLCLDSIYFLKKYGKIRDEIKGIIPWEPWPHLIKYLEVLHRYRFIILLKPKQIGATWCLAGDNLHLATFVEGANILTLSKGEDEATESLDYSRFMHNQLPDFLRLPKGKDQSSLITFPTMYSKIRALPSTEDAGVGFGGATRVNMDEAEYHRYDRQNFTEILPPILEGGQLIIQSTADPLKTGTLFKELYIAARHGDNNFYPIFFPYDVVPGRDEEWYNNLSKTGLRSWEIQGRFPRNEQEALATLKTRAFFDPDTIESMRLDCMAPLDHELSAKYRGLVKIYRLPVIGKKYCGFTDPSDGKDDPHAGIFIDGVTKEQVAESHGKIPADLCAQIHDELVRFYNNAFNSFEINATAGGHFDAKIKELETPNQCHRLNVDGTLDKKQFGWFTGKSLKGKAIWGLEEAIRLRQITPHSQECLNEFSQFIQPEGDEPQKISGGHDDYIDAWGRVLLLTKYQPHGTFTPVSFKYQQPW